MFQTKEQGNYLETYPNEMVISDLLNKESKIKVIKIPTEDRRAMCEQLRISTKRQKIQKGIRQKIIELKNIRTELKKSVRSSTAD